jgi:DNA (cytosine-5)-methyltransferase 1
MTTRKGRLRSPFPYPNTMNHASLFSGIGGFDLAAEWMGWRNVFHVERDPFCQRVLAHHFPNSQPFDDVTTFDGRPWRGRVDLLTGGFPCQPYSTAGKRLGKDDERHLWPEMRRIISEIAPTYVVGENVRGLINWNGGLVFEEVCVDLEALGFEVWTGIIPAAGVGAPHRRDRVWFVAHANGRSDVRTPGRDASASASEGLPERDEVRIPDQSGDVWDAPDTDGNKRSKRRMHAEGIRKAKRHTRARNARRNVWGTWDDFPSQPPVCGGDDGISRELDGITFSRWRNESIKAYGNAIVPQVAYQLFRALCDVK